MAVDIDDLRRGIGPTVRRLRTERRWTLAELASRLGTSASRLSEVERGQGSFTAEQLLVVFQTFQVGPAAFVGVATDADAFAGSLQNALVRFGAVHLRSDERHPVLRDHERVVDVVRDVLIQRPVPRFVTALPVVVVRRLAEVPFPAVQHAVVHAGVPGRWGWLLAHLVAASEALDLGDATTSFRRDLQQARAHALDFLDRVPRPGEGSSDLLDTDLRSLAGVRAARAASTAIDRRWQVVSRLSTDDFLPPLEALRDAG